MFALGLSALRVADQSASRDALKQRIRRVLNLSDDVSISVTRAACSDASCRRVQTSVLLFQPARPTCLLCIDNPLEAICDADILQASRQASRDELAFSDKSEALGSDQRRGHPA